MRNKFTLLILMFVFKAYLYSQDFHYSQFYNEPINFNPSLTGIFDGDQRFIMSMRDQYQSIAVPYLTFSGNYEFKLMPDVPKNGFFSGGIVFNYDKQGYSRLTLFNLNLTGSYSWLLNSKNVVSVGALVGLSNRGFNTEDLRWDNNWDPIIGYDKRKPSGENFENFRFSYLETGIGINYRLQMASRNNLTLGASVFHLTRPNQSFYKEDGNNLDMRSSFMGILNLKLIDPLDIQLDILHQRQDAYQETVIGGLLKIYINNSISKKFALHAGAMARLGEGFAPKLAIEYNEWYFGLSYDVVNKQNLASYSNYRGGPEMHLIYTIKRARPLGSFKICPIY